MPRTTGTELSRHQTGAVRERVCSQNLRSDGSRSDGSDLGQVVGASAEMKSLRAAMTSAGRSEYGS